MSAPTRLDAALLRALPLPAHQDAEDKNGRGCALVVGGSREVRGAVPLAGLAALRAGRGGCTSPRGTTWCPPWARPCRRRC